MNREIKIRAWDSINEEMKYPHNVNYSFSRVTSGDLLNRYEIVMQYSGLKDVDGEEIYEGDIVQDGCSLLIVKFTNGAFNFFTKKGNMIIYVDTTYYKVIGNIYETPHLLIDTEQTKAAR